MQKHSNTTEFDRLEQARMAAEAGANITASQQRLLQSAADSHENCRGFVQAGGMASFAMLVVGVIAVVGPGTQPLGFAAAGAGVAGLFGNFIANYRRVVINDALDTARKTSVRHVAAAKAAPK